MVRRLLSATALALLASSALAQPGGDISLTRLPSSVQSLVADGEVTALQGVTSAADKLFYFTGSGTGSVTTFSSAARGLLDDATIADIRTSLGLGSVNDTADANKPVSTATQTALDLKANLASPALTGTPTVPTAGGGTNTTQAASTAFVTGAVSDLIASAPSGLNTLDELAAAIGDDASYSTTISAALSGKQNLDAQLTSAAGLTFAGNALKVVRVNAGETDFETATLAGGGDALVASPLSQFAATTSAQLAGVVSDETGSGAAVFGTAPQISAVELSHATANTLAASGGHATIEGATIWDSGNDGAASTMDADLLDGSSSAAFAASGANTNLSSVYLDNTGLKLKDTNATHGLSLVPGSNITADRTLTVTTGDADRTLDVSAGSVTISTAGAALIDDADATAQRTTMGVAIGTNVQAFDADLTTWAGVTPGTGVATALATPSSANLAAALTDESGSGVVPFLAASTTAPTWGNTGTSNSIGNGTLSARTTKIGSRVFIDLLLSFGSTTSVGSGTMYFVPPSPYNGNFLGYCTGAVRAIDNGVQYYNAVAFTTAGSPNIEIVSQAGTNLWTSALPFAWGSGDNLWFSLSCDQ